MVALSDLETTIIDRAIPMLPTRVGREAGKPQLVCCPVQQRSLSGLETSQDYRFQEAPSQGQTIGRISALVPNDNERDDHALVPNWARDACGLSNTKAQCQVKKDERELRQKTGCLPPP
ncbi:hypothetical protein GCM10010987_36960 [Bradyrhizobium guangdongense]|uniref:Uncharacterized protein n=1 Tax=Bradyrhizobium guangdongense TaxID=1325090 RepID=A0AA87WA05_9BRAD|nr:hypothetical protein GCM10010987_36960 [Bradyrhizobium guangdongense]